LAISDYKKAADLGCEEGNKQLKDSFNIVYPVNIIHKENLK
jgi:hypothetical protein